MKDVNLTAHFKLSEFTKSSTATARHIDNTPTDEQVKNLKALCEKVLEPLRQHFNCPIIIASGYRSLALNKAVGGVSNSQHMTGEAADIHIPKIKDSNGIMHTNKELGRKWMSWLIDNTDFDCCIWETANKQDFWIHVTYKKDRSLNRHRVVSYLLKSR